MSDKISRYEAKIDEAVRGVLEVSNRHAVRTCPLYPEPARSSARYRCCACRGSVEGYHDYTLPAAIEVFHNFSAGMTT